MTHSSSIWPPSRPSMSAPSAANPKFAQLCGGLGCKLRVQKRPYRMELLEPISKSSEEDNEAGELDEAEEVLGVILPADEDAALPLDPSEEALDEPASH